MHILLVRLWDCMLLFFRRQGIYAAFDLYFLSSDFTIVTNISVDVLTSNNAVADNRQVCDCWIVQKVKKSKRKKYSCCASGIVVLDVCCFCTVFVFYVLFFFMLCLMLAVSVTVFVFMFFVFFFYIINASPPSRRNVIYDCTDEICYQKCACLWCEHFVLLFTFMPLISFVFTSMPLNRVMGPYTIIL